MTTAHIQNLLSDIVTVAIVQLTECSWVFHINLTVFAYLFAVLKVFASINGYHAFLPLETCFSRTGTK